MPNVSVLSNDSWPPHLLVIVLYYSCNLAIRWRLANNYTVTFTTKAQYALCFCCKRLSYLLANLTFYKLNITRKIINLWGNCVISALSHDVKIKYQPLEQKRIVCDCRNKFDAKHLRLGCFLKGLLQKTVLLDMTRIVRRFLSFSALTTAYLAPVLEVDDVLFYIFKYTFLSTFFCVFKNVVGMYINVIKLKLHFCLVWSTPVVSPSTYLVETT